MADGSITSELLARLGHEHFPGGLIDARIVRSRRRKHWVRDGLQRSSAFLAEPPEVVLRASADGREVYVATDSPSPEDLATALDVARHALPSGRPSSPSGFGSVGDGTSRWDPAAAADARLAAEPGPVLDALLTEAREAAAKLSAELDIELRVLEGSVLESRRHESFARSDGWGRSFERSDLETRLLVEAGSGERQVRVWGSVHTNRLDAIPLEDTLRETGLRASALSYEAAVGRGSSSMSSNADELPVLLAPQTAAALLRQLVHDVVDRGSACRPTETLRHRLIDEPAACPGGHSRPFDHEGAPTADTVFLDEFGTTALPVNVRIVPTESNAARDPAESGNPLRHTGLLGLGLRTEGTQLRRSGERLRFRVDTAEIRDGVVVGAPRPRFLVATRAQLLGAVRRVRPVAAFLPWDGYSTACAWLSMNNIFEH